MTRQWADIRVMDGGYMMDNYPEKMHTVADKMIYTIPN